MSKYVQSNSGRKAIKNLIQCDGISGGGLEIGQHHDAIAPAHCLNDFACFHDFSLHFAIICDTDFYRKNPWYFGLSFTTICKLKSYADFF